MKSLEVHMRSNPVEGMNDYLPQDVKIRDELMNAILATYTASGFQRITTPIVESIENLDNSDGGDNLKLIYRILKRGDKLKKAFDKNDIQDLADLGLRYDLTLPLVRYYTSNQAKLPMPFKCIQIDRVYRAERPQKGRLREFVQCDIDILGSEQNQSEIELIAVTAEALLHINIPDFTVRINHRQILRNLILFAGFAESEINTVCVILDKMDKIGLSGVQSELQENNFSSTAIEKIITILSEGITSPEQLINYGAGKEAETLMKILNSSKEIANGKYGVEFDLTLVRGQGYYTGTIFEISCNAFGGTIAGGGRYDHLIGKFTKKDVPAVGFSIGFERIYSVLSEKNTLQSGREKIALLYQEDQIVEAVKYAASLHTDYDVQLTITKKKLYKQLAQLEEQGFTYVVFLENTDEWKKLGSEQAN